MNIFKNFLPKNNFNEIYSTILTGDYFPWYYAPYQVTSSKKNTSYMFHTFIENGNINSSFINLINPILEKLKPKNVINVRANLYLKRPSYCSWHVDGFTKNLNHKTAIYYLNTNNGYTEFKNKKIKSLKNKMIVFDASLKHRAKAQTDKDVRVVINFNYELN